MNILLCVSASISIYKSCELIRIFKKSGHELKVVLSESASRMISPSVFEALSGNEVFVHDSGKMEHISLVRWCDILLLCPATASTIGKIANGIGGTLLLDVFLAKGNVRTVVAPAMNVEMWNNVFVVENLAKLKDNGFEVIEPESGILACGEEGVGKLANLNDIASAIQPKMDLKVLITAGGTIEKMDDVRYLTNVSSGKQALEIAKYFSSNGAEVEVIQARTDVNFPHYIKTHKVDSAQDMLACVQNMIHKFDVFISAAAVADFTFQKAEGKMKKGQIHSLQLIPNPDILQTVCNMDDKNRPKCVVGFAAESENLEVNAKGKMIQKGCDIMVGNELVFGKDVTKGVIFTKENQEKFDCSKKDLAQLIWDEVRISLR